MNVIMELNQTIFNIIPVNGTLEGPPILTVVTEILIPQGLIFYYRVKDMLMIKETPLMVTPLS